MKEYKLIGLTKYAENHLDEETFFYLHSMVGSIVSESSQKSRVDSKILLDMPDGEATHVDFLELEEIQPKFNFNESE